MGDKIETLYRELQEVCADVVSNFNITDKAELERTGRTLIDIETLTGGMAEIISMLAEQ